MLKEFRRVKTFSVFRRKEFCEGKHDARIENFVLNLAFSVRDEGDGVKRTGRVTYNGNVRFASLFLFRFGKMANTFYLPPPQKKQTPKSSKMDFSVLIDSLLDTLTLWFLHSWPKKNRRADNLGIELLGS